MNETTISEVQQPVQQVEGTGCLNELGWFFSGAVLPLGSFSFYRKASKHSVGSVILFFIAFTLVISSLLTIKVGAAMFSVVGEIQKAYAEGTIPEITITHGIAEVNGEQPAVLINNVDSNGDRLLIAADTTGQITHIDEDRFDQGFLLTRTELHMLTNQNGYQVVPLSQVNASFEKDPIIINAETVTQAWSATSIIVVIVAFLFLALWHIVIRLMIIALFGLLMWGIISLARPNTGFGPVIISGLYAIVPAIYLSHLFSRSGISLPGFQTFFLMVFWIIGIVASLSRSAFFSADRPIRLWTAWLGLPMLILFVVDIFTKFPSPYGPIVLWIITLLTWAVLIGVRLFFRFNDPKTEPPVMPEPLP